jgi:hypothetical protein
MSITLNFGRSTRVIAGSLGGKFLHCTMRPARGGALPPAGEYEILRPVIDPIYGRLALMAPVGGSGGILAEKHPDKLSAIGQKLFQKPNATLPAVSGRLPGKLDASAVSALFIKFDQASPATGKPIDTHGTAGGQVFVLSDRPVLGRNCIVVSSGFADLMDALQTSGGARVRMV